MKRQLVAAVSAAVVVAAASAALAANAATSSRPSARHTPAVRQFVGYWMGSTRSTAEIRAGGSRGRAAGGSR